MSEITYKRKGRIAYICLSMRYQGNAFTQSTRKSLNDALHKYKQDEEAWMAVVHADGHDFCTGSSLSELPTPDEKRENRLFWAGGYVEIWKPVIAAIQGQCKGEGLDLALGCDLRIAEEGATFEPNFEDLGDNPNISAIWLINQIGISATFELLWFNRKLDARYAAKLGLVNRIVTKGGSKSRSESAEPQGRLPMEPLKQEIQTPQGDVLTAATMLAEELLLYAPVTRTFQKETAYRCIGVPFSYAQLLEVGPNPYASQDRIEGNRAFVERRRPVWSNL